jgi:hypothetical protein
MPNDATYGALGTFHSVHFDSATSTSNLSSNDVVPELRICETFVRSQANKLHCFPTYSRTLLTTQQFKCFTFVTISIKPVPQGRTMISGCGKIGCFEDGRC